MVISSVFFFDLAHSGLVCAAFCRKLGRESIARWPLLILRCYSYGHSGLRHWGKSPGILHFFPVFSLTFSFLVLYLSFLLSLSFFCFVFSFLFYSFRFAAHSFSFSCYFFHLIIHFIFFLSYHIIFPSSFHFFLSSSLISIFFLSPSFLSSSTSFY